MAEGFGILIEDDSGCLPQAIAESSLNYFELYDWQKKAIDFFFINNMALFEVTTGAGKTQCVIEILKRIWADEPKLKALVVVPKNVILETGWHTELYNAGLSLGDIGVFYGSVKEYSKVTITNMQNVRDVAFELFDIVIWDEVHNYGTRSLLPFVAQPCKYKIGLTATLDRMDGAHNQLKKIFDYNIFTYSPKQALDDGVLNPFDFFNISVKMDDDNFDTYAKLTQEINVMIRAAGGFEKAMHNKKSALKFKLLAKFNERKDLVNNYPRKFDAVRLICEKHVKDKIIIFSEYNKTTNAFYWALIETGIKARIVHSDIKKEERDKALSDFKNNVANVLLVTRALDEGTNIPKLDVAIIAAGNSTARQTVQRLGRVLRRKNRKSSLYQVYIDGTIEQEYANGRTDMIRELCSDYDSFAYDEKKNVLVRK